MLQYCMWRFCSSWH